MSVQEFKVGDEVRLSEVEWYVPTVSHPGEVGTVERVYPANNTYTHEVRWPSVSGTEVFAPGELELAPVGRDAEEDGPYAGEGEVPPEDTLQRIKETLERIESNIPKSVEANLEATIEAQAEEIAFLNKLLDKAEMFEEDLADRNRILRAENEALREELERAQKAERKLALKALGWY